MDLTKLMNDANAETVAEYIGIRIQYKGNRKYILCPGHKNRLGKDDRKIGNCVLADHGYRCFACGETVGLVQMVMEQTGCSKGEAFGIIGDAMGGRDLYQDDATQKSGIKGPKERLTKEELDLLGITVGYNCSIITDNGMASDGLTVLYEEDREVYYSLLLKRAKDTVSSYRQLLSKYGYPSSKGSHDVYELLGDKYSEAVYSNIRNEVTRRIEVLQNAIAKLGQQAVAH